MTSLASRLPEVHFCERDTAKVEREIITTYEQIAGVSLYPGDPVRLYLEGLAYLIAQQRFVIDWTGRQNLLAYAEGDYLDHLGALVMTDRLSSQPARTTLRFSLDAPQPFAVPVPPGSRATPDSKLMFATDSYVEIPAGETSVDVQATCQTSGAAGNGFVPGQINRLVDALAYISSVVNATTSLEGADVESDDNYRERIHLAPERFSVAGPRGAYYFYARSAHPEIVDVAVYSPEPGRVNVAPLMADAEEPSAEILADVDAKVNDERVRPLTDSVTVHAPTPVPYTITLTWWLSKDDATLAGPIEAAVHKAVQDRALWQRTRLGRDIVPSRIIAAVVGAGAKRCEIESPEFTALEPWEVGIASSVTVIYGGLEER